MALELGANEPTLSAVAALPILLLGFYVFKSNSKELTNRVFAAMCLLWTIQILAFNLVGLSQDLATAQQWNRIGVYATFLFIPALLHFALVFPYHSRLLRLRWFVPVLYVAGLGAVALAILREGSLILEPFFFEPHQRYFANFRTPVDFFLTFGFTVGVVFLLMRLTFTDLDVTRKRLFFVTFALATYTFYEIGLHPRLSNDPDFTGGFRGYDASFWQLTLAADLLLVLVYFCLGTLIAIRARERTRRREALALLLAGAGALLAGFADPVLIAQLPAYTGVLWLWRIVAVGLMFYAILRYQLFDLHVRLRIGVRYSTMIALFAAVFFTVQELVKDFGGDALGYFTGLLAAAGLTFLFEPVQRLIERISHKVVPPSSTENYEKYRSMEIYRAALEGALADKVVSTAELHSLRNLRTKLGISDADHALLERDIRAAMEPRLA